MEYAKSLIKDRVAPTEEAQSDESWTFIDDKFPLDEHGSESKPARHQSAEGALSRLSKKFNLPTATTALSPNTWNRALKQKTEQLRNEAEGKPSELDVAEVKTVY